MAAGSYRNRVMIETLTVGRDPASGDATQAWGAARGWWCSIEPVTGGETKRGEKIEAGVTHVLKGRYGVTIRAKDRITKGTRAFEVLWVCDLQERHKELRVDCREVIE